MFTVFIVDDDARSREALSELLEAHGIRAVAFGSAGEYVRADKPDLPASLILDVELPDINGLDLQRQIADLSSKLEQLKAQDQQLQQQLETMRARFEARLERLEKGNASAKGKPR